MIGAGIIIETSPLPGGGYRAQVAEGGPEWARQWRAYQISHELAFRDLRFVLRGFLPSAQYIHAEH